MPGIYDTFSAHRAEQAGFEAVFVSGSALAIAHLARPDIGLLTMSETADIVARIADRVSVPLFVDADQGFGNAYMVARAVRMLERAGAAGVQIEDQAEVKPADAPLSRPLVPLEVMLDKIAAAQDARTDEALIISARTDAMSTAGIEEACRRADAFAAAGADLVFVESVTRRTDMERVHAAVGERTPMLHNLLRPDDEVADCATLARMGYSVALFPSVAVKAVGEALDAAFAALRADPRTAPPPIDRIGAAPFLAVEARGRKLAAGALPPQPRDGSAAAER